MSLYSSKSLLGFVTGCIVPPLVTKLFVKPVMIDAKFEEIDDLKHDLDNMGWHVRNLEEMKGYKDEDVYTPVSYFQGRY